MRRTAVPLLALCALVTLGGCGNGKRADGDAAPAATSGKAKTAKSEPAPAPKAEPAPAAQPAPKAETAKPAAPAADKPAAPAEKPAEAKVVNTICPVTGDLVDPQVPPVVVEISVGQPPLVVSIGTSSTRAAEIVRANPERYAPAALDNRKATSSLDKRLSQ